MTTPNDGPPARDGSPARRLGLFSAAALVVGEVIGVGIFLTPSDMARSLASPAWVLAIWGAMGLMAACGALTFGALAARYPRDGGGYVYLHRIFGPRPAFLYGWVSLLVTDPGITAMLGAGLARYAGSLVPLSPAGEKGVAIAAILAMAVANGAGLGFGAGVLRGLAGLKLGLLALIAAWGFGSGKGSWSHFTPFVERPADAGALVPALIGALMGGFFSMAGFWDAAKIAGDVRDPERTLPRAMVLGVSTVAIAYLLISAVFWYLVPLAEVDPSRGFAAQAGEVLFGEVGGRVFAGVVVLSVLGSLAGILMAAPRVYVAMARDGLFPAWIAATDPRTGTPARATALQAAIAALFVISGTFEQILSCVMAVTLALLAWTAAGAYVGAPATGPGRVPGGPITPLGFLVPVSLVIALQVMGDPVRAGGGLAVVAIGLVVYEVARRRRGAAAP